MRPVLPLVAIPALEQALREGGRIHGFRSGGGLRVVDIKCGTTQVAYGEAIHIMEAFRILAEDFRAGCRPYRTVYGPIEPFNESGAPTLEDYLDDWIFRGHTFDVHFEEGQFVFILSGLKRQKTPEDILEQVWKGRTVQWEERGFKFETKPLGSGLFGIRLVASTSVLSCPEGKTKVDSDWVNITKTGKASTLQEALDEAFLTDSVNQ